MFIKISQNIISQTYSIPQKDDSVIREAKTDVIDIESQPLLATLAMNNIGNVKNTDFNDLLYVVKLMRTKFPGYEIGSRLFNQIDQYIEGLYSATFWKLLSERVDCMFSNMNSRKFPRADSSIVTSVKDIKPYAPQLNGNMKPSAIKASNEEIKNSKDKIVDKLAEAVGDVEISKPVKEREVSNYSIFTVLNPQFYPDLMEYNRFIVLMEEAGLRPLCIKMLFVLALRYETCHIIKEEWFWMLWNKFIFDIHIKNYTIYYAAYILRLEEYKASKSISSQSRTIFTLEQARKFASVIPSIGVDKHPLVCLMEPVGFKSSYLPLYLEGERKINSMEEFKRRLSLITGGVFDKINLKKYNACITGSVLIPCISTNPLEKRFLSSRHIDDLFDNLIRETGNDENFMRYAECYYPSYNSVPDKKQLFIPEQTASQYEKQKKQDLETDDRNHEDIMPQSNYYDLISDVDISIHTPTFEKFKIHAYELFEDLKKVVNGEIYLGRVKRTGHYKYMIYGPGLLRPIDLFWIARTPDEFVSQFHLGVVRNYYDGVDVKIMYSSLVAHLTGINHDYRWLSTSNDVRNIIAKKIMCGYTTALNKNERASFYDYIMQSAKWKNSFGEESIKIENLFKPVRPEHIFFKPDITNSGIRHKLSPFESGDDKIINEAVKWNVITPIVLNTPLHYMNKEKNSIGIPDVNLISKYSKL